MGGHCFAAYNVKSEDTMKCLALYYIRPAVVAAEPPKKPMRAVMMYLQMFRITTIVFFFI